MPMRLGTPQPSLEGATEWIGGTPDTDGANAVMIHFWALSCHICHETMADVLRIRDTYAVNGLRTVAVHMPRMEADTDVEKVKVDMANYGITQPCAIDNLHHIANRFESEHVPAFFIFDKAGVLKFRAAGDRGFAKVEPKIREALGLSQR